jgi:hypothetical protein
MTAYRRQTFTMRVKATPYIASTAPTSVAMRRIISRQSTSLSA